MLNVLLVEDELIIRQGMKSLIQWNRHGFQIFEAAHGEEALNILRNRNIDILITDIVMPVMDGLTLIKKVHEEKIPCEVIILSSHDEFEYARKALQLKVRDYIYKPTILPDEFIKMLKSIALEFKHHKEEENYREIIMETAEHSSKFILEKVIKKAIFGDLIDEKLLKMLHGCKLVENHVYLRLITFIHPINVGENNKNEESSEEKILASFLNNDCSKDNTSAVFYRVDQNWVIVSAEEDLITGEWTYNNNKNCDELIILTVECQRALTLQDLCEEYKEIVGKLNEIKQEWKENYGIHPIVKDSLKSIHANYMTDISLDTISKQIHVSPSYFSKLFDEEVGINFINYLTNLRIKKAKELLVNTNLTIYNIANKVGYKNSKYFTKVFKKNAQTTPGEYRKENRV